MKKTKVLVDLAFGHKKCGFSGIPQDTRLLFSGLSSSSQLSISGMLWSTTAPWRGKSLDDIESQSTFLGPHLHHAQMRFSARIMARYNYKIAEKFERISSIFPWNKYSIHKLSDDIMKDIIWRQFFASTVDIKERDTVLSQQFILSDLGFWPASDAAYLASSSVKLDTNGYDAILFQDSRNIIPSPGTRKFIRYHDGLPVLASDTMLSPNLIKRHIRSIKTSAKNSVYVCNSTSAKQDLVHIHPVASENAVVIPYFVPRLERHEVTGDALLDLARIRISSSTINQKTNPMECVHKWFDIIDPPIVRNLENLKSAPVAIPEFILSLATIEPRKNYQGLLRAWARLRMKTARNIKLVIIGKPGWEFDSILADMRPYVAAGHLLHLQGVAQDELPYWYSSAKCFAFPSVAEGFGLPPIEAMQCGTPVMVSDIPAHRYSCGEAALFCNPYDPADMASKLEKILSEPCFDLVRRGYHNAERFTRESVLPLWEELFATGTIRQ